MRQRRASCRAAALGALCGVRSRACEDVACAPGLVCGARRVNYFRDPCGLSMSTSVCGWPSRLLVRIAGFRQSNDRRFSWHRHTQSRRCGNACSTNTKLHNMALSTLPDHERLALLLRHHARQQSCGDSHATPSRILGHMVWPTPTQVSKGEDVCSPESAGYRPRGGATTHSGSPALRSLLTPSWSRSLNSRPASTLPPAD